jgi:hypothetical protein
MKGQEYQIIAHSNPLLDVLRGWGPDRGLDTHESQCYNDDDARGRAVRTEREALGVELTLSAVRFGSHTTTTDQQSDPF